MNQSPVIDELFETLSTHPTSVLEWAVRAIGYAVTADRIVQPGEKPYLMSLISIIRKHPEISHVLPEILHPQGSPQLPPLTIDLEIAETIFRCVLQICASHNITNEEIAYINHVGVALGLSSSKTHHLINSVVRTHIKNLSLKQLVRSLNKKVRYWVAVMMLKLIQADEQIDHDEAYYLEDIHELLQKDSYLINAAKKDALDKPLSEFEKLDIEKSNALSILKYLLEILMGKGDMDERELEMIQGIAELLNFKETELNKIIETVSFEVSTER